LPPPPQCARARPRETIMACGPLHEPHGESPPP
jgi:hypothetical protein